MTPNIIGTCKGNHGFTACAVKNNLGSSLEGLLYALGNFKISVSYMTLCFLIKVSYGQQESLLLFTGFCCSVVVVLF